ncbi:hypothetical protein F2Q68_00030510 [Brassica cretica]|uniref:Uncharacterized protein n=1 Tax=Brassica cretica TaxID=69181 RepID=A0A8S9G674_BRACR|nr:hypothetical protein F2Q68_00030510 [Brassica cretica]
MKSLRSPSLKVGENLSDIATQLSISIFGDDDEYSRITNQKGITIEAWYVDMISNSEVAYVFRKRAKVGKSIPEEEILTKAITLAKEWTSCQEKIPPPSCKTPSCTQPAPNCSVLNTDAAWKASNLTAGLGWTIKTQEETAEFTKPCRFVDCFDCRRVGSARSTSTMTENIKADRLARSAQNQQSFVVHMDAELPPWFTEAT